MFPRGTRGIDRDHAPPGITFPIDQEQRVAPEHTIVHALGHERRTLGLGPIPKVEVVADKRGDVLTIVGVHRRDVTAVRNARSEELPVCFHRRPETVLEQAGLNGPPAGVQGALGVRQKLDAIVDGIGQDLSTRRPRLGVDEVDFALVCAAQVPAVSEYPPVSRYMPERDPHRPVRGQGFRIHQVLAPGPRGPAGPRSRDSTDRPVAAGRSSARL